MNETEFTTLISQSVSPSIFSDSIRKAMMVFFLRTVTDKNQFWQN